LGAKAEYVRPIGLCFLRFFRFERLLQGEGQDPEIPPGDLGPAAADAQPVGAGLQALQRQAEEEQVLAGNDLLDQDRMARVLGGNDLDVGRAGAFDDPR
jgi:hypothetical protein